MSGGVGLAAYGCEPDEAGLFAELSPRFGVVATTTAEPVAPSNLPGPGTRCVSVGHKAEVAGPTLRALRDVGVEHLSTRSIGVDHIDLRAAAALGIVVEPVPYAPDGVADYTVMLTLMALRHAPAIVGAAAQHDFRLRPSRGRDLRDLTVGVVGVGRIGTAVIRRLHGFGCRVLAWGDRSAAGAAGAAPVALDELLGESDVVTLHLPLGAGTRHLLGPEQVARMKPGALLVNTGRGALVDTGAVVAALEAGHLGGVALDVLEGEEGLFYADRTAAPVDHQLLLRLQQLPNAIITPHTAFHTERALHDTVEGTLRRCLRFERSRLDDQAQDRDLVRGLL